MTLADLDTITYVITVNNGSRYIIKGGWKSTNDISEAMIFADISSARTFLKIIKERSWSTACVKPIHKKVFFQAALKGKRK